MSQDDLWSGAFARNRLELLLNARHPQISAVETDVPALVRVLELGVGRHMLAHIQVRENFPTPAETLAACRTVLVPKLTAAFGQASLAQAGLADKAIVVVEPGDRAADGQLRALVFSRDRGAWRPCL